MPLLFNGFGFNFIDRFRKPRPGKGLRVLRRLNPALNGWLSPMDRKTTVLTCPDFRGIWGQWVGKLVYWGEFFSAGVLMNGISLVFPTGFSWMPERGQEFESRVSHPDAFRQGRQGLCFEQGRKAPSPCIRRRRRFRNRSPSHHLLVERVVHESIPVRMAAPPLRGSDRRGAGGFSAGFPLLDAFWQGRWGFLTGEQARLPGG